MITRGLYHCSLWKRLMRLWQLCLCRAVRSGAEDVQAMREGGFHGAALHASAAEPLPSSWETAAWNWLEKMITLICPQKTLLTTVRLDSRFNTVTCVSLSVCVCVSAWLEDISNVWFWVCYTGTSCRSLSLLEWSHPFGLFSCQVFSLSLFQAAVKTHASVFINVTLYTWILMSSLLVLYEENTVIRLKQGSRQLMF